MQQPHLPFYNFQDGNGPWMSQENNPKHHNIHPQIPNQWDNNQYHVTGNTYGPGQVTGGGVQTRGGVGPQQPPQPSQPTPTNTPPGGMHSEMAKQPVPQTGTQIFSSRHMATQMQYNTRGTIPQQTQPMRGHGQRVFTTTNVHQQIMHPQAMVPTAALYNLPTTQVHMFQHQARQASYSNQPISPLYMQQFIPTPQYYPQMISSQYQPGAPAPQVTSPQMPMVRTNLVPQTQQPQPTVKTEQKKRTHAIKIIDPSTNEEVSIETGTNNNNNVTPTHSNDSSARETPQPGVPMVDNNAVIAEFSAKVSATLDNQHPDHSDMDNISDSETLHKQSPVVVPVVSDRVSSTLNTAVSSTLNTASLEFIPRSSMVMQVPLASETPDEPPRPPVVTVPTVSAEKDSPAVDIQRPPVLTKHPPVSSSALVTQSPQKTTKKQKGGENEQQVTAVSEPLQPQPEVRDNKKGPKTVQREEPVQMPKERREKPRPAPVEQPLAQIPVTAAEFVPSVPVTLVLEPISAAKDVSEDLSANKPRHYNGEMLEHEPSPVPAPTLPPASVPAPPDSNKTAKRQSGKKSGNKMRDLNRKGTEKEGSEMDAFTTEPTIMSEEKEKTPSPINSPPPTPPPEVAEPEDKIQEDIEEKEDKLVAAKNEENTKVSALNRPEIEPVEEEKQPPQLTLRHSYSKDQWSPLNPEGKKKYDRDFLFNLRGEPLCTKKPDNLPDVVAGMIRDYSAKSMNFMNNRPDMSAVINPGFMRSQSQKGGMLPRKGSQQGSRKGGSRVIQISLSLNEDVKLKTTENAWKPNRLEADAGKSDQEKETEELLKNVRGILNKLTPQKFDKLMARFQKLPINSEHRLVQVINLIFDKAVDEPSFSKAYAQMCQLCSKLEVTKLVDSKEEKVNFRKMLITRCQSEFEKNKVAELDTEKWHEEINSCSDPEKKKELQLAYEEKERAIRMKSVGNIRFIGELFKLKMLTPQIMHRCIEHLLGNSAEESLECLCKLLTTIGKDLEMATTNAKTPQQGPPPMVLFNKYFQTMSELSRNKGHSAKVSSRVRFMLQDVIDLRQNKWVPRRDDNNPKTIEQINKEAEREAMEMTMALNQPPPRMNRQNDRSDDRKQRNRNQNDADGWNTVTSNSRYHKFPPSNSAFESSKMQNVKNDDISSVSLGGSQMYRFQMGGKTAELKSSTFNSSNAFSPLSRGDERKPPQPMMNNRRMTPTPSIEKDKERQRMMQFTKESDGRSSRESSAQRDRPQTPLRDNSMPRQPPSQPRRDEPPRQLSDEELRKAKDKLERQSQTLIEEYLGGDSPTEDVRLEVEQIFTAHNCGGFVQKALDICMEKKPPVQKKIGLLLTALMDSNLFTPEVVVEQFGIIYEIIEDLAIDIPKIWDLQAEIIVPILAVEKLNFSHFKDACGAVLKTKAATDLLLPVLSLLVKEKGDGFVRHLWDSSNVNLQNFLPEEVNVDNFVEEKSLKYLTGEAPRYEAFSMDQVQERILKLIQNSQPYETILDFINANMGDRVEDVSFIRALVAAFCEACIGPSYALNTDNFKRYEKLIERFVDHKEDRELACLSSVHTLCSKLQHPQGLILTIFTQLLDDNLISSESFLKWKDDTHEPLETKGVSVFALKSFFSALEEVETDDETS